MSISMRTLSSKVDVVTTVTTVTTTKAVIERTDANGKVISTVQDVKTVTYTAGSTPLPPKSIIDTPVVDVSVIAEDAPEIGIDIHAGEHEVEYKDFLDDEGHADWSNWKPYMETLPATPAGMLEAIRVSTPVKQLPHPTEYNVAKPFVGDDEIFALYLNANIKRENERVANGEAYYGVDGEMYTYEIDDVKFRESLKFIKLARHFDDIGFDVPHYEMDDMEDVDLPTLAYEWASTLGFMCEAHSEYENAVGRDVVDKLWLELAEKLLVAYK